jgi:hypothetical protein
MHLIHKWLYNRQDLSHVTRPSHYHPILTLRFLIPGMHADVVAAEGAVAAAGTYTDVDPLGSSTQHVP